MSETQSIPAAKIKLAALLVLIGLLNLAVSSTDCCRLDEDGDPIPELLDWCFSGGGFELKPGETRTGITVTSFCDPIDQGLPWTLFWSGAVKSATLANPNASSTTLQITVLDDPRVVDELSISVVYANRIYGSANVGLSRKPPFTRLRGGVFSVNVDVSSLIDPFTREDKRFEGPAISVNPRLLGFGNVKVGTLSNLIGRIIITNRGNKDLAVSISLTQNENNFGGAVGSFTFKPHTAFSLAASFIPLSAGFKTANFIIGSNDPSFPSVTVTVTGTGVP